MTSAVNTSSALSIRYAGALADLAQNAKALAAVEKDLTELSTMIESSSDLSLLIKSPLLSTDQQQNALSALAKKAKFHKLTQNFLGTLVQNGRLSSLQGIIGAFHKDASARRGEVSVNVTVAQDMSAKQVKALTDTLSKSIGAAVNLNIQVEPSILGGLIVTVGSHMIDDSVVRKLERLQVAMNKQSNQNTVINMKEAK